MPFFSQHSQSRPARPQQQLTGTTSSSLLKRYRPLETRAAGGFGSVEICLDSRLHRRVAIKRMPLMAQEGMNATAVHTALAEAQTASMLQHPNIASVIDFTFDAQYAYLVMEYVDGMSLEEFLAKVDGHSLTYDEAAYVADALGQALQFAHENGVLHLDVKPANVLIDRNGHVKLTDFGMATLSAAAGFGGARGGTVGYMPPEQLNNEAVGPQTDLFALAAVLYESLCGTAPFRAGTPSDSMNRIVKGVIYPSDLLPTIPELTEDSLVSALSPMPRDRPASVSAFCDRFCAQLGNTRAGQRSLASMIDELTRAEEDEADEELLGTAPERTWTLDPAKGYLGSRYERAREYTVGALSAAVTGYCSYLLLRAAGVTGTAVPVGALAIGLASGVAPQMGSALVAAGFLTFTLNATVSAAGALYALPGAVLFFALFAGWWLVWGRSAPAASMVLTLCVALGHGAGSELAVMLGGVAGATWPVSVPVALAAYFLAPGTAAVTCGFGLVFARLFAAANAAQGVLSITGTMSALASAPFWLQVAATAGAGALLSRLLQQGWQNYQDSQGKGLIYASCALAAIMGILLFCLARPMEITSLEPHALASGLGGAVLSSIIVWICLYLLGYRKEPSEGDRS